MRLTVIIGLAFSNAVTALCIAALSDPAASTSSKVIVTGLVIAAALAEEEALELVLELEDPPPAQAEAVNTMTAAADTIAAALL
ncbi:MAG: hypothetical protein ACRDOU_07520 [Streptosporangiaceae bacterium]